METGSRYFWLLDLIAYGFFRQKKSPCAYCKGCFWGQFFILDLIANRVFRFYFVLDLINNGDLRFYFVLNLIFYGNCAFFSLETLTQAEKIFRKLLVLIATNKCISKVEIYISKSNYPCLMKVRWRGRGLMRPLPSIFRAFPMYRGHSTGPWRKMSSKLPVSGVEGLCERYDWRRSRIILNRS